MFLTQSTSMSNFSNLSDFSLVAVDLRFDKILGRLNEFRISKISFFFVLSEVCDC